MREKGRFPELVQLAMPEGANEALDRLADLKHATKSAVARRALLDELEANGVPLAPAVSPSDAVESARALLARIGTRAP
jgi:hypothetical protein